MKNKHVGMLIVGISLLVGFLVWLFNKALSDIVSENCSHGPTCPMWGSINFQTNVGIGVMIFMILLGLYLIFLAKDDTQVIKEVHRETRIVKEQIKPKKIDRQNYAKILESLDDDGKKIFGLILDSQGSIFQSELVSKTNLSKVKITRILDRLEGKDLIERKRRGMTNVIILKH